MRAPVDITAHDVDVFAVFGNQVDVLEITIGEADGSILIDGFNRCGRLAQQGIKRRCSRIVFFSRGLRFRTMSNEDRSCFHYPACTAKHRARFGTVLPSV